MSRFAFSFAVIISGLASGFVFGRLLAGPLASHRVRAERLRVKLQIFALLGINPVAFVGAVWALQLADGSLAALPLIGITTLLFGALLGRVGAGMLRLPPEKAGVYIPSSSFTNIGSIGGLIIFVLVGETGFALVPFYKLLEETWYYSVLFPLARRYGAKVRAANGTSGSGAGGTAPGSSGSGFIAIVVRIVTDPFIMISLGSVILGLTLNLSGAKRPAFYSGLNAVLIPLASWIVLFTIGMRMKIGRLFTDLPTTGLIMAARALMPFFAVGLGLLLGLGRSGDTILLKTVLILSSMPIGFLGVVPPAMYGLDVELANRLWLFSNAALVISVPLLSVLVDAL